MTTPDVLLVSTASTVSIFDFNWKIAVAGFLYVYRNGALVYSYTGDTTGGGRTLVNRLRIRGQGNSATPGQNYTASEVIISDESTIGARLITAPFNAAGGVSDWTGAVTDINALASSDGTYISSDTDAQISTFTKAAIAALGVDETISAVALAFRSNVEPASPVTNLSPVVRISAVNYPQTSIALSSLVTAKQVFLSLNPATGLAWASMTEVNDSEFGFRADT